MKAHPQWKRDEAVRLQQEGLTTYEIAKRLGASQGTVVRWTNPAYAARAQAASQARKARYRGRCEECGAPTNGAAGPGRASRRCGACANAEVWTRERILNAIREWVNEHGVPPVTYDWAPSTARAHGVYPRHGGQFEAEAGRWPAHETVHNKFGSFTAAIRAAGFAPRYTRGSSPETLPLILRRLAAGDRTADIAADLGITSEAIHRRLKYRGLSVRDIRAGQVPA